MWFYGSMILVSSPAWCPLAVCPDLKLHNRIHWLWIWEFWINTSKIFRSNKGGSKQQEQSPGLRRTGAWRHIETLPHGKHVNGPRHETRPSSCVSVKHTDFYWSLAAVAEDWRWPYKFARCPRVSASAVKLSIGSTTGCTITEKAHTRAFSWLKVATTAFTFKTLWRHYA